jgi:hypothetical protein
MNNHNSQFAIRESRIMYITTMKTISGMRPQDVVVLAKIIALGKSPWKGIDLSRQLHLSASEISESLHRSVTARLIDAEKRIVQTATFLDFLVYGIRVVYPASLGGFQRGIPTAYSAAPLNKRISSDEQLVWAYEDGNARGQVVEPLYPTVPLAAKEDTGLHALLALIDTLRVGKVREIQLAKEELSKRFAEYAIH